VCIPEDHPREGSGSLVCALRFSVWDSLVMIYYEWDS
jgi:hypothetical protein